LILLTAKSYKNYKIIEGCTCENEKIKFRMHLNAMQLNPTFEGLHFSVRYFMNIVIIDD
jgi:hypothetical protein